MPQEKPKRRWYQFSLRTMFAGMTLGCIVMGWVAYQLKWIEDRKALIQTKDLILFTGAGRFDDPTPPPYTLRLFGEREGFSLIQLKDGNSTKVDYVRQIFPEASVRADFVLHPPLRPTE